MVAIGGIADIVQHWHEMARSRMTQCMVRPCVARRFWRVGGERSCINVSDLWLELSSGPPWISARVRAH